MDATTPAIISAGVGVVAQVLAIAAFIWTIWKTRSDVLRAEKERREDIDRSRNDRAKEIERERHDKQAAKRAEVAGDALVATLDFLTTLHDVSLPVIVAWEGLDEKSAQPFREHLRSHVKMVTASFSEFKKAWQLAETYLPEEAVAILEEISQVANTIRYSQANLSEFPAGLSDPLVQELLRDGLGKKPQDRLAILRSRAREILRPLAQLEPVRH